jgi:hypothetical protein
MSYKYESINFLVKVLSGLAEKLVNVQRYCADITEIKVMVLPGRR